VIGWLLVLAGTVLFFLSTLGTPSRLIPSWLAYFGRISYGLYLVHSLVFFLVFEKFIPYLGRLVPNLHLPATLRNGLATGLVLAISLALAHLSYAYFESFFLRLKQRFTLVAARD
jgi:peptidoglycan/LPS O-acetylase OafA/YrhL